MFAVEKKAVSGVVGYCELCIFALSFMEDTRRPRYRLQAPRLPAPAGFFLWWFLLCSAHSFVIFRQNYTLHQSKTLVFSQIINNNGLKTHKIGAYYCKSVLCIYSKTSVLFIYTCIVGHHPGAAVSIGHGDGGGILARRSPGRGRSMGICKF